MNTFIRISRGYGVLLSIILLSLFLTTSLLLASAHQLTTRYSQLERLDQTRADALALGCIYAAIQSFAEDPGYTPNNTDFSAVPSNTCSIDSLSFGNGLVRTAVHARVQNAVAAYAATAIANPDGTFTIRKIIFGTSVPP